jgi:hypothetical protein
MHKMGPGCDSVSGRQRGRRVSPHIRKGKRPRHRRRQGVASWLVRSRFATQGYRRGATGGPAARGSDGGGGRVDRSVEDTNPAFRDRFGARAELDEASDEVTLLADLLNGLNRFRYLRTPETLAE